MYAKNLIRNWFEINYFTTSYKSSSSELGEIKLVQHLNLKILRSGYNNRSELQLVTYIRYSSCELVIIRLMRDQFSIRF